jgi:hypothetical protein
LIPYIFDYHILGLEFFYIYYMKEKNHTQVRNKRHYDVYTIIMRQQQCFDNNDLQVF